MVSTLILWLFEILCYLKLTRFLTDSQYFKRKPGKNENHVTKPWQDKELILNKLYANCTDMEIFW